MSVPDPLCWPWTSPYTYIGFDPAHWDGDTVVTVFIPTLMPTPVVAVVIFSAGGWL